MRYLNFGCRMNYTFSQLQLPSFLLKTCKNLQINNPYPVQIATIPQIIGGRNIVALSPTGTGKTASFAFPIISTLSSDPYGIYCLVLTPTRELGLQIAQQFEIFGRGMNIEVARVFGGLSVPDQARELEKNPHIIVATPGRMKQHIQINTQCNLSDLRYVVLDEADRLCHEGFWDDVISILSSLPSKRQTLLFSATMRDKDELIKVLTPLPSPPRISELNAPGIHHLSSDGTTYFWEPDLKSQPKIQHFKISVPDEASEIYLTVLLQKILTPKTDSNQNQEKSQETSIQFDSSVEKINVEQLSLDKSFTQVIIFTNQCEIAEMITLLLRTLKFKTAMLHSKIDQDDRFKAVSDFKSGFQQVLVCTDLGARGLDLPCVDTVIHFNQPGKPELYVHRSGRTGRAGREGRSILFINHRTKQEFLDKLEETVGSKFIEIDLNKQETVSVMKEVLVAKKQARITMSENDYAAHVQRIDEIKKAEKALSDISD